MKRSTTHPFNTVAWLATLAITALGSGVGHAVPVTGPSDPNYDLAFQGASAHTFGNLGFTVGTGPGDLKVDTGTWSDPAGLTFGSVHTMGNPGVSGTTTNRLTYAYTTYGHSAATANARDYDWLQNNGTNATTNPANDQPWRGTIWDLGGQANQAVVFPIVDHNPLPQEAVEYTVYLSNDPSSTSLSDWNLATLDAVYLQGWEVDSIALADGFTTVWKLPGNQTFRYVSVEAVGSQALRNLYGNEDEIDAVAGLTVSGGGLGGAIPEPSTLLLMGVGLAGLGVVGRRRLAA